MMVAASSAQATENGWRITSDDDVERCEITLPGGRYNHRTVEVDCCTIGPDGRAQSEACQPVAQALHNKRMRVLKRALAVTTRNTIARFLKANPDTSIGSFTVEVPPLTSVAYCCECNPSMLSCDGGGSVNECEGPNSDNGCDEGLKRYLCTDIGMQDCLPID